MPVPQPSPCQPLPALDAIAAGVLLVCGLVFLPGAGQSPFWDLSGIVAVPVWLACLGMLVLRHSARPLFRAKLAALALAGLAPFAAWSFRYGGNLFLVVNGTLATFAAIWFAYEIVELVVAEARHLGNPDLLRAGRNGLFLLTYFLLIPVAALHVSFALSILADSGAILEDLRDSWHLVPAPLRWIPLLPAANVGRLAWLLRATLAANLSEKEPT
ncbi:MAG: hypothetical protein RBU25_17030 [Lentisphaeria bacterium]|jgi:hypothetical protein|nr:hypothetical protein [Lentisphaeria bacterium]